MALALRRTGSTGFRGHRSGSSVIERIAGLVFVTAILLCAAGPILQLTGVVDPIVALDGGLAHIAGTALATIGIAVTVAVQLAMGNAWRIGVDPTERTDLVVDGPFSIVRNPIFAAMIPSFTGIALLATNIVTIAGAVVLIVALELQTRLIEEPHLMRIHGGRYARYAARVGRFLPEVGRLRIE